MICYAFLNKMLQKCKRGTIPSTLGDSGKAASSFNLDFCGGQGMKEAGLLSAFRDV